MPEETEPITPPVIPVPPQAGPPTPPWGSDADFDPQKAWSLIQNVRGDLEKKNARIAELTPFEAKARDLEDAQKSEVQRLTEQVAAAQQTAQERATEAMRLRVALRHGISDEDAEIFLTGATEEAITKQAERLAALRPAVTPPTAQRTPVEALRPGALPNAPQPTLQDRIAELRKDPKKNMRELLSLENQKLVDIVTNSQ